MLGITAVHLWTAAGFIAFSYPTEQRKGAYISMQWGLLSVGSEYPWTTADSSEEITSFRYDRLTRGIRHQLQCQRRSVPRFRLHCLHNPHVSRLLHRTFRHRQARRCAKTRRDGNCSLPTQRVAGRGESSKADLPELEDVGPDYPHVWVRSRHHRVFNSQRYVREILELIGTDGHASSVLRHPNAQSQFGLLLSYASCRRAWYYATSR